MKKISNVIRIAVLAIATVFTACSSDDDVRLTPTLITTAIPQNDSLHATPLLTKTAISTVDVAEEMAEVAEPTVEITVVATSTPIPTATLSPTVAADILDNKIIVSTEIGMNSQERIDETNAGLLQAVGQISFAQEVVYDITWSADGRLMAISLIQSVHVYAMPTLELLAQIDFEGLPGELQFGPDDKVLAIGYDGGVTIIELDGFSFYKRFIAEAAHRVTPTFAWDLSSDRLIISPAFPISHGVFTLFDAFEVGTRRNLYTTYVPDVGYARFLRFSPDGLNFVTGSVLDGKIRVWDAHNCSLLFSTDGEQAIFDNNNLFVVNRAALEVWDPNAFSLNASNTFDAIDEVAAIALAPNDKLVSIASSQEIFVIERHRLNPVKLISSQIGEYEAIEFSPLGNLFAALEVNRNGQGGDDEAIRSKIIFYAILGQQE